MSIGTIDYITGKVVIDGFRPLRINDGSDYIKLIVKPNLRDIMPKGNTILTINTNGNDGYKVTTIQTSAMVKNPTLRRPRTPTIALRYIL
mgnify:CR=1 FL=1